MVTTHRCHSRESGNPVDKVLSWIPDQVGDDKWSGFYGILCMMKLILAIIDGLGVSMAKDGNPVAAAKKPVLDALEREFPFTTLQASGVAVGLPWGEAGNSEVGHLTMGSGRVLQHHLPRIISSIHDGSFFSNERLKAAVEHASSGTGRVHIAGLISSGSVHSYIDHLWALLDLTAQHRIPNVFIHAFCDGKDAPPREAAAFLGSLQERLRKEWPNAALVSVVGRFFAMDRDLQWDRIRVAYELLGEGKGMAISSVSAYLSSSYERGVTDEFIEPAAVGDQAGGLVGRIKDGDTLLFLNFREDSMRELTQAFMEDDFDAFPQRKINNLFVATMTDYEKRLSHLAAFPTSDVVSPLAEVFGEEGLRHLHIAESQKYAHVTYFFNGGREQPFPGEERILIPSLSSAHFDETPGMKAAEITQGIISNLDRTDVIIANFANLDMVGHSGNMQAGVRAVEIIDESIGRIAQAAQEKDAVLIITGDHGGIEMKRNMISGEKLTEHSTNPVPFHLVADSFRRSHPAGDGEIRRQKSETGGILTDIAPTILDILGIKKPPAMTGVSLLPLLKRQIQ